MSGVPLLQGKLGAFEWVRERARAWVVGCVRLFERTGFAPCELRSVPSPSRLLMDAFGARASPFRPCWRRSKRSTARRLAPGSPTGAVSSVGFPLPHVVCFWTKVSGQSCCAGLWRVCWFTDGCAGGGGGGVCLRQYSQIGSRTRIEVRISEFYCGFHRSCDIKHKSLFSKKKPNRAQL